MADFLFLTFAIVFTIVGTGSSCSGSVSVNTNPTPDPNRALGTYSVPGSFAESASNVFFGYWLDGGSGFDPAEGQALQLAIGNIHSSARITVVPGSILYEETATETATGKTITVSISGTWSYDLQNRIRVNWGAAIVTESTFSFLPPFTVATVGTRIQGAQPNDLIISNSAWSQLTNAIPGPLNGVFTRVN